MYTHKGRLSGVLTVISTGSLCTSRIKGSNIVIGRFRGWGKDEMSPEVCAFLSFLRSFDYTFRKDIHNSKRV